MAAPPLENAFRLAERLRSGDLSCRPGAILEASGGDRAAVRAAIRLLRAELLADDAGFLASPVLESPPPWLRDTGPRVELAVGEFVGPYRVTGEIGRGANGVVYRAASPPPLEREVALKTLDERATDRERDRFQREQRILASLRHPGIAQVFDAGTTESGLVYTAVELVEGQTLSDWSATLPERDDEPRVSLFLGVLRALRYAHDRGVVHRDLKPSNILVERIDGLPSAKLIDFGSAGLSGNPSPEGPLSDVFVGTLLYMSPEQFADASGASPVSDVYSAGIVLYELLTGVHPIGSRTVTINRALRLLETGPSFDTPEFARLPRALADPVIRATARRVEDRYDSVLEFEEDLTRALPPAAIAAGVRSRGGRRRFRVAVPVLGAAAVATAGLAWLASPGLSGSRGGTSGAPSSYEDASDRMNDMLVDLGDQSGSAELRSEVAGMLSEIRVDPGQETGTDRVRAALVREAEADALANDDRHDEAAALRLEAVGCLRAAVAERDDASTRTHLIRLMVKVGDAHGELAGYPEQIEWYVRAHEELRALEPLLDEREYARRWCFSLERLGFYWWRRGEHDRARSYSDERLEIALALVAEEPAGEDYYNAAWAICHSRTMQRFTDPAEALEYAALAAAYAARADELRPNRWMYQWIRVMAELGHLQAQVAATGDFDRKQAKETWGRTIEFAAENPDQPLAVLWKERVYRWMKENF